MAVPTLGADAPAVSPSPSSSTSTPAVPAAGKLRLVPGTTRTRRNHGVFMLGSELASVYSSRRETDGRGVILTVGAGALVLNGAMTPTQARSLARALEAAASAVQTRLGGVR